ncbi:hypothetical protein N7E81_16690 [Reichenbachiella carrageenanivorans]|uniref:Histidine kinase n=1 Tax=Reichenbachiella carrageenanivorans TaxID=2979869 RepID=A0ABY6D1N7_9BACT|nr:hypothetical protein [Reichenbachiella carrageenanivorans]UXX78993.1 hypothetical protein N7E81_16690 [Reichenbachiella carrageenanivorans]
MDSIDQNITHDNSKLFKVALLCGATLLLLNILKSLWLGGDVNILKIDSLACAITLLALVVWKRGVYLSLLVKLYCLSWVPLYVMYWKFYGGIDGAFSYVYFSLLVLFLGVLEGRTRFYMVLALCLTNVILTLDSEAEILITIAKPQNLMSPLAASYLVNSVIVAGVIIYIKIKFDEEREHIEANNRRLDLVNKELSMKHELLTNQQRQIKRIQNNLEELVHERTIELENRNRELEDYAYDNAHVVRRPLSNILSLLEILDHEKGSVTNEPQLKNIQEQAVALDKVVQKINSILK